MNRLGKLFVGLALASVGASGVALAGPQVIVDCTGGPCNGTGADEVFFGTEGPDQINAFGGEDVMFADDAKDVLRGGGGDDFGGGGFGDDTYVGGSGNDSFEEFSKSGGDEGNDVMKGGKGADLLAPGIGRDRVLGGRGNDRRQFKKAPPPRHQGIAGCFRGFCPLLLGEEGSDLIKGGRGRDYMRGGAERDRMLGGKGADVIDAATDDAQGVKDVVECGDGRDIVFANGADKVADDCERVKPPPEKQE